VASESNPTSSPATASHKVYASASKHSGDASVTSESSSQLKDKPKHVAQNATAPESDLPSERPEEHGGQAGPEPTRYGDWEKKGRCTDF